MARFKNVETVSLLNSARLFLQKSLKKGDFAAWKEVSDDEETISLTDKTFSMTGLSDYEDYQEDNCMETGICLNSIFNVFSGAEGRNSAVFFKPQEMPSTMVLPVHIEKAGDKSPDMNTIAARLLKKLREKKFSKFSANQLLRLLEVSLSYVPDGMLEGKVSDISLYDRAKLAAAFSACLSQYMIERNTAVTEESDLLSQPAFLMVSGDISGIQQFIYTIPSKGALKSLRGRSFYLEILLENIVDEILEACGISRSCLLYTGGGHFYLLAPNTERTVAILSAYRKRINSWFLQKFGTLLYMAMGWTPCTAGDLTSNRTGKIYQKVGQEVAKDKLCRYDEDNLAALFSPDSDFNKSRYGARECSICHMSNVDLEPYNTEDGAEACPMCRNLFLLGRNVIAEETAFIVTKTSGKDDLPIPGLKEDYYLKAISSSAESLQKNKPVAVRIYVKNMIYLDWPDVIYLWISDYVYRNELGKVLEFNELASLTGGQEEETGIERLAVLRADVDNLGAAFISGFPEKYASLMRTSALSRYLSLFFKRYVNLICKGDLTGVPEELKESFSLFGLSKGKKRRVHVVYSGGDDLFIVGAWDDLIELAVDIRRIFGRFTNEKLSFSAGIGFFRDKCPISQMARKTGDLEDSAKDNEGKDSVALFGVDSEVQKDCVTEVQKYKWNVFWDKVCGEKLKLLLENVATEENKDPSKLKIGKTALYRLLSLMEGEIEQKSSVNIARFAYTLARMEPDKQSDSQEAYKKVRRNFYEWYKTEPDRKQLSTALQLLIYRLREKGVQTNG